MKNSLLNLPSKSEVPINQVVEISGIPRRTIMRYCDKFDSFIPRHVRRPPEKNTSRGGARRVLYFEHEAVEKLKLVRELSRRKLSEGEILSKLRLADRSSPGEIRIREKVIPLLRELGRRHNSLPEIYDFPDDFRFAPLAGAIKMVEKVLDVNLPSSVKAIGAARYEKLILLMNVMFFYYFREGLFGGALEKRMTDYLSESVREAEEEKVLQEFLVKAMGISGRWASKEKKRIRFFVYELIEVLDWSAGGVIELITKSRLKINIPIPLAEEIQNYWWDLLDSILICKKEIRKFGFSDELVKRVIRVRTQQHNSKVV